VEADEARKEKDGVREDEAEAMARLQEEIRNLPVSDHLLYMMQSLSGLAIARMGLAADGDARRDLDQARLAIDAFKALLGLVESAGQGAEMTSHRGMLSQLQLAYVGVLGLGEAPPASAAAAAATTPPAEAAPEAAATPPKPRGSRRSKRTDP
jgi:hypothetical protein